MYLRHNGGYIEYNIYVYYTIVKYFERKLNEKLKEIILLVSIEMYF